MISTIVIRNHRFFCLCLGSSMWPSQSLSGLSWNSTARLTSGCVNECQRLGRLKNNPACRCEFVHRWAQVCSHVLDFFTLPQLAPTSFRGQFGKPERHTALKWTSQPNMSSSSTRLTEPVMYPWTAIFTSEIYSPSTWTHSTSVTLDISEWVVLFSAVGRQAGEGIDISWALPWGQVLHRKHYILFMQVSGLSVRA